MDETPRSDLFSFPGHCCIILMDFSTTFQMMFCSISLTSIQASDSFNSTLIGFARSFLVLEHNLLVSLCSEVSEWKWEFIRKWAFALQLNALVLSTFDL